MNVVINELYYLVFFLISDVNSVYFQREEEKAAKVRTQKKWN